MALAQPSLAQGDLAQLVGTAASKSAEIGGIRAMPVHRLEPLLVAQVTGCIEAGSAI